MRDRPRAETSPHLLFALLTLCCLATAQAPVQAQDGTAAQDAPLSPSTILARVSEGRDLTDAGDVTAIAHLRALSQDSLDTLGAAVTRAEEARGGSFDDRSSAAFGLRKAREAAANAHLAWGQAADRFARRDEAITALARALDLANQAAPQTRPESPGESTPLQRDSRASLNAVLGGGLPLLAADDALEIIAAQAHGKLWAPRRFNMPLPAALTAPVLDATLAFGVKPNLAMPASELLVTSGKLFPPENSAAQRGESRMARIPPLYRAVPNESLPASLKMDRAVVGYVRESSGPNKGLWRQTVRVYYASTYQTQNNRDDRPRAEALCLQFLRVAAMTKAGLGLTNTYNADGVTTLWLSEVSAWWPSDDEEPGVSDRLPARMPQPNTPLRAGGKLQREVDSTPLVRPWRAAATLDSAPGDILFFKMKQPRPEAEWLREAIHEYGHVVLPPFDRFAPPLEPYGNGMIGESLGMLWAGSTPNAWLLPDGLVPPPATPEDLPRELTTHVSQYALPSLKQFQASGPQSNLRTDRTVNGLRYLTGLAVYLERVYGAPLLGKALRPLVRKNSPSAPGNIAALTADSLLNTAHSVLRDGVESSTKPLPVWLGGVLDTKTSAAAVMARAPVTLNNITASGWIYVPAKANKLNIVWQGGAAAKLGPVGWKLWASQREATVDTRVLTLSTVNRTGWQKLSLSASGPVKITAASFEQWLE